MTTEQVDLTQRRLEVEAKLAQLRNQRGMAYNVGRDYDSTEIIELEQQLDALDVATGIRGVRDREEAEAVRKQRYAKLLVALGEEWHAYLACCQDEETSARTWRGSYTGRQAKARKIIELCNALGRSPPPHLSDKDVETRASGYMQSMMRTLSRISEGWFGQIKLTGHDLFKPDDWATQESARIWPTIRDILNDGKDKANGHDPS